MISVRMNISFSVLQLLLCDFYDFQMKNFKFLCKFLFPSVEINSDLIVVLTNLHSLNGLDTHTNTATI